MKKNSPFASLASLSVFMVIFAGFAVVLVAAGWFVSYTAFGEFDTAWSRMDALEQLENSILFDQNEVFINEAYYVYAWEYDSGPEEMAINYSDRQDADARVTEALNGLVESGVFDASLYDTHSQALVDDLIALRQQDGDIFKQLVNAIETEDMEQVDRLLTNTRQQSSAILAKFDQLVVMLEDERTVAVANFPGDLSLAITSVLVGIVISMLLALWGYRRISGLTAPLLRLHAGVSAIGADTFRPEILASARRTPGQIGVLARTLQSLNETMSQRDAQQKDELARLKKELIQSRRRRLRLLGKPGDSQTPGEGGAR